MAHVTLISSDSDRNWMESAAIRQLEAVAAYPGVTRIAGLPDLHPGRTPVGLAALATGHIYPYLLGQDLGCGLALFKTGLPVRKLKLEKWADRLARDRCFGAVPVPNPFSEEAPFDNLGTLGGGNHFLEFQKAEKIIEPETWAGLGLDPEETLLLVHTGSRGFGRRIMAEFSAETGYAFPGSEAARYLERHEQALLWAGRNRALVAEKVMDFLGFSRRPELALDLPHNYLERRGDAFLHRKGAVSAEVGPTILPGSRGSWTYLLRPAAETEKALWSLAHGAGRKWERGLCRARLEKKYDRAGLGRTVLRGRVVGHDLELLFQEAPEAYKNINEVVASLTEHDLARAAALLRPLLTFKG